MDTSYMKDRVAKKDNAKIMTATAAAGESASAGTSVGMPVNRKLKFAIKPGWFRKGWQKIVGRSSTTNASRVIGVQQSRSVPLTYRLRRGGAGIQPVSISQNLKKDSFNSVCGFASTSTASVYSRDIIDLVF